ncbi:MAG: PAS domain-containing protein, partial [Xanthobacteraceae bacterium]
MLVNKKGEEFIGRTKQDIIGKVAYEIFPPEAARTIDEHDRAALGLPTPLGYESAPFHLAGDDSQRVLTKKLIVRDADGEADYLLSIIVDVTERVRAESRLSHQAHHDALTGLANRVLFAERIGEALA